MKIFSIFLVVCTLGGTAQAQVSANWESAKARFDSASGSIDRDIFQQLEGRRLQGRCYKFEDKDKGIEADYTIVVLSRRDQLLRPVLVLDTRGLLGSAVGVAGGIMTFSINSGPRRLVGEIHKTEAGDFPAEISEPFPKADGLANCNSLVCRSGSTYCDFKLVE